MLFQSTLIPTSLLSTAQTATMAHLTIPICTTSMRQATGTLATLVRMTILTLETPISMPKCPILRSTAAPPRLPTTLISTIPNCITNPNLFLLQFIIMLQLCLMSMHTMMAFMIDLKTHTTGAIKAYIS